MTLLGCQKATLDDFDLLHHRLDHINFRDLSKNSKKKCTRTTKYANNQDNGMWSMSKRKTNKISKETYAELVQKETNLLQRIKSYSYETGAGILSSIY